MEFEFVKFGVQNIPLGDLLLKQKINEVEQLQVFILYISDTAASGRHKSFLKAGTISSRIIAWIVFDPYFPWT